jgi:lysine 2,3-aminomutase
MMGATIPLIRLGLRPIHLLPQGAKGGTEFDHALSLPSPLVGEGARRADEGFAPHEMEQAL